MAVEKVTMPQLGESVTEGTISSWLVKAGDQVNKYDPIAEVETDKVNAEVPSSFTGTIKEIVAKEGETIEVGELICYMEIESAGEDSATEEKNEKTEENNESNAVEENKDQSMKKRYSPAVMRMAQENDIDLNLVDGSGKGGRITRKDIEKIIASGDIPKPSAQEETPAQQVADETKTKSAKKQSQSPSVPTQDGDIEIPVTGVRKAIAQNMVTSTTEIPHAWMTVEVDVTDLVAFRICEKSGIQAK